jgi:hypothetical protein
MIRLWREIITGVFVYDQVVVIWPKIALGALALYPPANNANFHNSSLVYHRRVASSRFGTLEEAVFKWLCFLINVLKSIDITIALW